MNPAIHLLVLAVFIDLIGFGIIIPLLPLYAEAFHADRVTIGLLMATFSFWQFIFAPILGRWSDRIGRRPVLLASLLGTVIGYVPLAVAHLFTETHLAWLGGAPLGLMLLFVSRTIDGMSGGNISTAQAYIADITTPEDRVKGMGMIGAAFGLGFIFGPVMGSALAPFGFQWPAIAAMTLGTINLIWAWKSLPESRTQDSPPAGKPFSLAAVIHTFANPDMGKLVLLVFVATFAFAQLETTLTLYLQDRLGFAPKEAAARTGMYFAYLGFVVVIIQGGLIRRLRGKNLETILVAGGTLSFAIGLTWLAWNRNAWLMLIPLALIAAGSGFVNPSLTSLISRRADPEAMGETLGTSQGMSGLARILGPVTAGVLMGHGAAHSIDMPYYLGGAIMFGAFLMALTIHFQNGAGDAAPETAR